MTSAFPFAVWPFYRFNVFGFDARIYTRDMRVIS